MPNPSQPPMWGAPRPPRRMNPKAKGLAIAGACFLGIFIVLAIVGSFIGSPKKTATTDAAASVSPTVSTSATPMAVATTASPSPSLTALSPTPTTVKPAPTTAKPTTKPPAKPKASAKACTPTRDVIVWMKVPSLDDSAQVLGNYDLVTCETTFQSLQETSPTDAGYCTEAAWASDNPGYNADATPAKRLKKVQVVIGPAC